MKEALSLRVDQVYEKGGLLHVVARWLSGSALDIDNLVLERTGKPFSVHERHFAEEPMSLLLICGKYMPAAREVAPGDVLVASQSNSQTHS